MRFKLWQKLRSMARRNAMERDLEDEIRFHLAQQAEEFEKRGVSDEQSADAARLRFGNVTFHKEQCRDTWSVAWIEALAQDLRFAWRTLRRRPGFATVAVLTLSLGIGATTAMVSVLEHTVLHPVVARDPARIVWLQESSKAHEESGSNPARLSNWQAAHSFSAVTGTYSEDLAWASPDGPVALSTLRFYGDLAGVLQPTFALGRGFTAAESRGAQQTVAVLTHKAFVERFHSDAAILNHVIRLAGVDYQVIGVLSPELNFPEDVDVWTPALLPVPSRVAGFLDVAARLAPGVTCQEAQAEVNLIATQLGREYAATDAGRSARLTLLPEYVGNAARKPMLVLFGAVASIFLIGCLNVAGLLLARGLARRREAAIRVSLGAGYARLVRMFLAESLLLAGSGCLGGLALAFASIDVLKSNLPGYVPNLQSIQIDAPTVLGGVVCSLLAALIFGAVPAWQFWRDGQAGALKQGGAGTSGISAGGRLRSGLVAGEVALAVTLLVTAALLSSSFVRMVNRPLGFNPLQSFTFRVNLPWDVAPSEIASLSSRVLDRLQAMPGTEAYGVVDRIPLHGGSQTSALIVRDKALTPTLADLEFRWRTASAGSFAALGIPLRTGRMYRGLQEAVISDRLAAILFPGEDPIGHEIAERSSKKDVKPEWFRVVGVVGSMPFTAVNHEPEAEMYIPWGATYWPIMNFVMRSNRQLKDVSRFVRSEVQKLSPDQPFSEVSPLENRIAETRSPARAATLLLAGFAVVGLSLSALGIFGLMAHEAQRRKQEFGVRLALGAQRRAIAFDSLQRGLKPALVGMALGLAGAWFASALVKSLLFEVTPHDAASYAIAAALLLAAAIIACLAPAVEAARVNPIEALREE